MPHAAPPTGAIEALTDADRILIQAALSDPLLIPLERPDLSGRIALIEGLGTDETRA